MVGAAARWFDGVPDAITAEALAAREGLELALELGTDRVVLEVDCQGLARLLREPSASRSSIGGLCFDIIELGKSFSDFRIEWVRRGANSVAHVCDRSYFWIDSIPDWLAELAVMDCNHDLNE